MPSVAEAPELLFSETFVDVPFFAQEQLPFVQGGEEMRKLEEVIAFLLESKAIPLLKW